MSSDNRPEPIRVCFVSPKAYPLFDPQAEGVIGGAEVDLYLLATELAKDSDYQVSCITADYNQPDQRTIENVKIIKSLNFKQNPITSAIKIWKTLKKANADIYMIKTASPGVPLAAAFCKLKEKIFVYRTAHQRECDGTYLRGHFFLGRAFAASLRSARLIFAQNEVDCQNLKKTMSLDSIVIPNGHRHRQVFPEDKETILWVGRSAEFKKPQRFLDLAAKFPDEKFTMICQRATGDKDYESLVDKAGQIKNLDFRTSVPFHEIDTYFAKAKVLVNTSDSEGFPNTFIQAAKAETAILSYAVNPDNFLDEYECGSAANADINQLSKLLNQTLKNNRYKEMGKKAKQYFQKKHDVTKIIEEYKTYFSDVIDD